MLLITVCSLHNNPPDFLWLINIRKVSSTSPYSFDFCYSHK